MNTDVLKIPFAIRFTLTRTQKFACALVATLILAWMTWVYPTLYRYDRIGANPIRINRVTGEIDFCTLQGWTPQIPFFGQAR